MTNPQNSNMPNSNMQGDRIAKVLARAGVASRREAERMITAGRITLNGSVLKTPAVTVTDEDVILVDGQPLAAKEPPRLWRYHKPPGLMTTHKDPEGRPTVFENLPAGMPRVVSVGRLDMNSEGLLLLTNDGELARQLELPSTAWARKYRARAYGHITQEKLDRLQKGITIDGVKTGPIEAVLEKQKGDNAWIAVTIREGKNREVRRALDELGLTVNRLIRLAYGPFQLGSLSKHEVDEVQRSTLRDQVGHLVDIPKGRPGDTKSVLSGNKKKNIKHVPKSKASAKRGRPDRSAAPFSEDTEQTPVQPGRKPKKNNAKWGKEKSAAMRAQKNQERNDKLTGRPARRGDKPADRDRSFNKAGKPVKKSGWAKPKNRSDNTTKGKR